MECHATQTLHITHCMSRIAHQAVHFTNGTEGHATCNARQSTILALHVTMQFMSSKPHHALHAIKARDQLFSLVA